MKPIRISTILISALLGAGVLQSETDSHPTVDQIVARYVEAIGGESAWRQIKTVQMSGSYVFNGETHPMIVTLGRPARLRFELEIDGAPYIIATDGTAGWRYFKQDSETAVLMTAEETKQLVEDWADFDGPLIDYKKNGTEVSFIDLVELDGVACYHLEISLASGGRQDWFIDTDAYSLVRRTSEQVHRRRGPYQRVWYYESFHREGSVVLPQYYEREDSQHVRAYDFTSYRLNVDLPEETFSAPPGAQPADD